LNAVQNGHVDIGDHDRRANSPDKVDEFLACSRPANDFEVFFSRDLPGDPESGSRYRR
jgi:hypothetical protein